MSENIASQRPFSKPNIDASIDLSQTDAQQLSEFTLFRSFFAAQLVTVVLVTLIYMNYLLLGDYVFCFFLAILTSVSLRKVKARIISAVEVSFKEPWQYTKGTLIFIFAAAILDTLTTGNFDATFEKATILIDRTIASR